jgi:hypothetical protein
MKVFNRKKIHSESQEQAATIKLAVVLCENGDPVSYFLIQHLLLSKNIQGVISIAIPRNVQSLI